VKITLTKQEAERNLETYFYHKLEEAFLSITISECSPLLTPQELDDLWRKNIRPVNDVPELKSAKIDLMKFYRDLHNQLTRTAPGLDQMKRFVETHKH
jgi:hypothetical protein